MPTNLPPDYFNAEKRFREAESAAEKVALLEEMYSLVPKHKGTDHLRADLRRQLSKLKDDAQQARKRHGGHLPIYVIEKEGAGQVALIGPTNVGKSALLDVLTNAEPEVSAVPFTTRLPVPGMMPVENVQVQLVDTPATDLGFVDPGLFDLVRRSDLVLLVIDLQGNTLQQLEDTLALLLDHRIAPQGSEARYADHERMRYIPLAIVVNKCDDESSDADFDVLCELLDPQYFIAGKCPLLPISTATGRNLDVLKHWVLDHLEIIRVYARPPGKEPDLARPFVLKKGSTIADLAAKIHKDFVENLKSARVWGSSAFEGQMVQRDYILQDGDIVELRA
jgi:small GTP-binding protein